jgi:hypothetical protein
MSVPTENLAGATEIRPFRIEVPDEALDDLRRRIAATRWPSRELVADRSQGVQLATVQALARYWTTDYDWRKAEAKLNALPQFTTTIDGVDIHFLHVKSPHEHALPLLMTHGWPGSVIELLETVGPLADPTSHGGRAEDAFQLVLPSLPGYGFSGEPADLGWNVGRVAQAWAELMRRLGRNQQAAQGRRQLLHRHPPLRPRRPGRELRVLPRGQHDPRAERAAQNPAVGPARAGHRRRGKLRGHDPRHDEARGGRRGGRGRSQRPLGRRAGSRGAAGRADRIPRPYRAGVSA